MIILKLLQFYFFMNLITSHLHCYTESFYIILKLKQEITMFSQFLEKKYLQHFDSFVRNCTYNLLFFEKKSKIIFLTSLIMKNIVVFHAQSRYLAKLICGIAFRSTSSAWSMGVLHVLFDLCIKKIVQLCVSNLVLRLVQIIYCSFYRPLDTKNAICLFNWLFVIKPVFFPRQLFIELTVTNNVLVTVLIKNVNSSFCYDLSCGNIIYV